MSPRLKRLFDGKDADSAIRFAKGKLRLKMTSGEFSEQEAAASSGQWRVFSNGKVLKAVPDCARTVDDDDAISRVPNAPVRVHGDVRRLLHQRLRDAVRTLQTLEELSNRPSRVLWTCLG